jgi:hypothetical protein
MRALLVVVAVIAVILLGMIAMNSGKSDYERAQAAYNKCVKRVNRKYGNDRYTVTAQREINACDSHRRR